MALRRRIIIFVVLMLFSVSASAGSPEPDPTYDIQCGCYKKPANAARFVRHLQELGLSWYSIEMDLCTRFIVDVSVDSKGKSAFLASHSEFADAFLVENYWDLPRPDTKGISPLTTGEEFTAIMAPYMQREYEHGYYNRRGLPMAGQRAKTYTRWIYEAATYYDLDPFLLFAVGNFETYFRNMFGDLDRIRHKRPDPAQGMFQILGSTARIIYRDMKDRKLPHAPDELPADLRSYPKTQIYFAAHYLHALHLRHHGNPYMALLSYNSASKPNYDYPRKVMRFYQRAVRYFVEACERYRKGQTAAVR